MILIKGIEYIEVDRDPYQILSESLPYQAVMVSNGTECRPESVECLTEFVSGRRFVRPSDGTDVVIGMSKDVSRLIGIQFEAYENIEKELKQWINRTSELSGKVNKAEKAGFFQRLKWLFNGIDLRNKQQQTTGE